MPDVLATEEKPLAQRIVIVIDRSGSMMSIKDDVIGGVNSYISNVVANLKEGTKCYVTIIYFETDVDVSCVDIPIEDFVPLTSDSYMPNGWTALYDALGYSINKGVSSELECGKTLVVTMTDGHENSSKEFTRDGIQSLIKEKEATGSWTFIFLGADMDAAAASTTIGISAGNTRSYTKSSSAKMFAGLGIATANFIQADPVGSTYSTQSFFDDAGVGEQDLLDSKTP